MFGIRTPPRSRNKPQEQYEQYNYQQQQNYDYQQHSQNYPKRAFMSSLATMYSDYESNLNHKRQMQEILAENLRKQIEEKKARSQIGQDVRSRPYAQQHTEEYMNQTRNMAPVSINQLAKTQPIPRVSFGFSENNAPLQAEQEKSLARTQPIPRYGNTIVAERPRYAPIRFEQIAISNDPPKRISVQTESPFAHQSVVTPPLGFSVRNVQPLRNSYPGKQQMHRGMKNMYSRPTPSFMDTSRTCPNQNIAGRPMLSTSEMVYPDGRIEAY